MTCRRPERDELSGLLLPELGSLCGFAFSDQLADDAAKLTSLDLLRLNSDTAPHFPEKNVDRICAIIDTVLYTFRPESDGSTHSEYTGTDRQLVLLSAQASEILSLQTPDKILVETAKRMYLLFLKLGSNSSGAEVAYWHVLLRFLNRGWISSANALYQQRKRYHKRIDSEKVSDLGIRAKNITALLHYHNHQYQDAEQAISIGIDWICASDRHHVSRERRGLLFLLLVNHCRLLAKVGRTELAVQALTALQSCIRKRSTAESLSNVLGRHMPSWFDESVRGIRSRVFCRRRTVASVRRPYGLC